MKRPLTRKQTKQRRQKSQPKKQTSLREQEGAHVTTHWSIVSGPVDKTNQSKSSHRRAQERDRDAALRQAAGSGFPARLAPPSPYHTHTHTHTPLSLSLRPSFSLTRSHSLTHSLSLSLWNGLSILLLQSSLYCRNVLIRKTNKRQTGLRCQNGDSRITAQAPSRNQPRWHSGSDVPLLSWVRGRKVTSAKEQGPYRPVTDE